MPLAGTGPAAAIPPSEPLCPQGDLCMWKYADFGGGRYNHSGSDANLHNDRFRYLNTTQTVADNTRSVWNNGISNRYGLVHVLAYVRGAHEPWKPWTGAAICVRQGVRKNLPAGYAGTISSYRWVTHSLCRLYPQL